MTAPGVVACTETSDPFAGLNLSVKDYAALAEQGFVAPEFRTYAGKKLGPYFKLRWRSGGRQRVRYLGTDAARIARIKTVLAELQSPKQLIRELTQMMTEARAGLHDTKEILKPQCAAAGLMFHGFTLRKTASSAGPRPQDTRKTLPRDHFL